jgi:hypothetical protein
VLIPPERHLIGRLKNFEKSFSHIDSDVEKSFSQENRVGEDIWKISVRKADAQRFTTLRRLQV